MTNCINNIAQYVGLPYRQANCWQLACKVMAEQFAIKLPMFEDVDEVNSDQVSKHIRGELRKRRWHRLTTPNNGCLVLLQRANMPYHIGVYLDMGGSLGVLHTSEATGAMFTPMLELQAVWNLGGFYCYEAN